MPDVTPPPSSEDASIRMRATGRRDTACELLVRRQLHARGLRYRIDHPLHFNRRRRADIVFVRERLAVFIDGCFWHSCPEHGTVPRANRSWWEAKLARNRERDADTIRRLGDSGWLGLRFWEHEDPSGVADQIEQAVRSRRAEMGVHA
ncbi:MAG: very short patch repair endonuclease [Planctomycetota bacterium]